MGRRIPMAAARAKLAELLDEVEAGEVVEITRNGRPAAVVVPVDAWARVSGETPQFVAAWQEWRASVDRDDLPASLDELGDLRDRDPGRPVAL